MVIIITQTNSYLVQCKNCHTPNRLYPPRENYDIILNEPCPMCNGLAQTFSCDSCYHKNTIYWDERHFGPSRENR
jgi:hypothetical protein